MTDDFRYYLRVRYGECDAQKVVFNARYGDYVDLAATEFLRAIGVIQLGGGNDFGYQVVKYTIEWKAPARFHQVLELSVRTSHVGNTSFTLDVAFRLAGEDKVIARAELVAVSVDPHTLEKRAITPEQRQLLTRGAPGVRVDHAGYLTPSA